MSRNKKKTIDGRISSYLWIDLSNFNKSYRKNVSYDKVFSRKNTFVKTRGGHDDLAPPPPQAFLGLIKIFAFVLDNKFCFFRYAIHANASDFIHKI